MQDNNLRIAFDYKYPDTAALVVYESWGSSMFGGDASIRVRKAIVGEEAIKLYSQLTGKNIPDIHKEAAYKINNRSVSDSTLASEVLSKKIFETKEEKEIPKKVLNIGYNSRDFCNYGKCPTCNNTVEGQSISGHTDETCPKCGQRLEWE